MRLQPYRHQSVEDGTLCSNAACGQPLKGAGFVHQQTQQALCGPCFYTTRDAVLEMEGPQCTEEGCTQAGEEVAAAEK